MSAVLSPLLTAEEFAARPDPGYPEELVRGRIIRMPPPRIRHGQICFQAAFLLGLFVKERGLGHVLTNDSGVVTERDPDSVRGPDVSYYSYERLPQGPLPSIYATKSPELVIEVRSPAERWPKTLAKVAEYLEAGTNVVVVLDDEGDIAHVYEANGDNRMLHSEEDLVLPSVLPDFRVRVGCFFE